jgi:hypothetical protein
MSSLFLKRKEAAMSGGLLDHVFEAAKVVRESGVTFDEAMQIVHTKHQPAPESNVIYGVDFSRHKDEDGLA